MSAPAVQQAIQALMANRLNLAAQLLRDHLQASPSDVEALDVLANVQMRGGRPDRASETWRKLIAISPQADQARFGLANALTMLGRLGEALEEARHVASRIEGPEPQHLLATIYNLLGEQEQALDVYSALLERDPGPQAITWLRYGHTLRMLGRTDDAIAAYRKSIELQPTLGEAYWSLADLKVFRFSQDEVAQMRAQLQRGALGSEEQSFFFYALGKALEDSGLPAEAFANYSAGAKLRASPNPDPSRITPFVKRAAEIFTRAFFEARAGFGCDAADPIFVVGLPRSGSTLVEQILASHSEVEATMELPDLQAIARGLGAGAGDYLDAVSELDADAARAMGEAYLEATRVRRNQGTRFFIDKMPSNWAHIGLLQLILPKAKIIDVRRHPMACGWSCFKQHFPLGQSFTYDLAEIGRYYASYVNLMAHYDAQLPGRVHRVIYEHLVADPEPHIRTLLQHCGLAFEPACLTPHATTRNIRSASSEQVRRPISAKGLEDWKAYEPWLGPLREALGETLDAYPNPA